MAGYLVLAHETATRPLLVGRLRWIAAHGDPVAPAARRIADAHFRFNSACLDRRAKCLRETATAGVGFVPDDLNTGVIAHHMRGATGGHAIRPRFCDGAHLLPIAQHPPAASVEDLSHTHRPALSAGP